MIAAYLAAMRRYVDFTGRASRSEFWWFHLSLAILLLVAVGVDTLVMADSESAGTPITGLVYLAHVLPGLAVVVRRLHDTDRSGWSWLVVLVPLVGPVILLVWDCQLGLPGANRFGPDPLATPTGPFARSGHSLAAAARDVVSDIERLAGLKANGTLSQGEFEMLKAQALAGEARA